MQKLAGIILLIGIVIAFFGEGQPVISEVYGTADLQAQLDAIAADSGGWATANTLMAVGGIVVAVGLILFAVQIQNLSVDKQMKTAAYGGAGAAILGALLHAVARYNIINSWETFDGLPIPYPLAWIIGLVVTGLVLLRTGYPKWLGWFLVVTSGLMLVGMIVGFLPPALIYIPLIVMSVVLLAKAPPQPTLAEPSARIA